MEGETPGRVRGAWRREEIEVEVRNGAAIELQMFSVDPGLDLRKTDARLPLWAGCGSEHMAGGFESLRGGDPSG